MNISATLDGESVTIVSITVGGSEVYISYITTSAELMTKRLKRKDGLILATNVTIN
jgi:hypothetical protein